MKWSPLIAFSVLVSCDTKPKEIGKYVYVDCYSTIHIDRECASKLSENPKTEEERTANMLGVNFVDTCELSPYSNGYKFSFCPKCIDDDVYKHLQTIMERNQIKPPAY